MKPVLRTFSCKAAGDGRGVLRRGRQPVRRVCPVLLRPVSPQMAAGVSRFLRKNSFAPSPRLLGSNPTACTRKISELANLDRA